MRSRGKPRPGRAPAPPLRVLLLSRGPRPRRAALPGQAVPRSWRQPLRAWRSHRRDGGLLFALYRDGRLLVGLGRTAGFSSFFCSIFAAGGVGVSSRLVTSVGPAGRSSRFGCTGPRRTFFRGLLAPDLEGMIGGRSSRLNQRPAGFFALRRAAGAVGRGSSRFRAAGGAAAGTPSCALRASASPAVLRMARRFGRQPDPRSPRQRLHQFRALERKLQTTFFADFRRFPR